MILSRLNHTHADVHIFIFVEMFQLWMNSIHCYCRLEDQKNKFESNTADNKKDKHNYLEPPVIIVGSHKDKVEPSEEKKVFIECF